MPASLFLNPITSPVMISHGFYRVWTMSPARRTITKASSKDASYALLLRRLCKQCMFTPTPSSSILTTHFLEISVTASTAEDPRSNRTKCKRSCKWSPNLERSLYEPLQYIIRTELNEWYAALPSNLLADATSLPHVMMLHLAFWWCMLLLHRPVYRLDRNPESAARKVSIAPSSQSHIE